MNTDITNNPFSLPINAYAAFDASSLKSLMIQRLSQGNVFTDQIYEGSNFNSLLDIIAYSYNVLLFYLNKTASESIFSQAQLYENMNKIVKLLGYNPIGVQTSILSFNTTAPSSLPSGVYTIPRYSYFTINGIPYSFTEDATFIKNSDGDEVLQNLSDSSVLYQGLMTPYPSYIANGAPYEEFILAAVGDEGNADLIDHNNIHVYVTTKNGTYEQWNRVNSLYLESSNSKSFECRLNENQRYVIKFGDNVNGKQIPQNSLITVFYLRSSGYAGQIGPNVLDGNRLFLYNQPTYNKIFNDIKTNTTYLNDAQASLLSFSNSSPSTVFNGYESTKDIRNNAPNLFKTQYRLVTTTDTELYIKNNFNNVINDVAVLNNWEYLAEHVRYLYNLGLRSPNNDSRVLFNQVTFADSCDFNNLYVYVVPKLQNNNFSTTLRNNFLNTGLKDKIINTIQNLKMATTEIVMMDPVYIAVSLGVASIDEINNKELTTSIGDETTILVGRSPNSRFSENEIKSQINNIITSYFSVENCKLGQTIDLLSLTSSILSLEGVTSLRTQRVVNGQQIVKNGLSFMVFNPVYSDSNEDINIINQNLTLQRFKIPYLYKSETIFSKIFVVTPDTQEISLREY
jgi:hypothetical protein